MFLQAEIAAFPGLGVVNPDPGGWLLGGRAAPLLSRSGENRAWGDELSGLEAFRGQSALGVDGVRQGRQDRNRSRVRWSIRDLRWERSLFRDISSSGWGTARPTHTPADRVVHRPLREVEVEGPHHGQVVDP